MRRPSKKSYFLSMARLVSTRSTCVRRQVGCILVDKNNFVLATGYNGVGKGQVHCITTPCAGANFPRGKGLDKCEAIHAEQNALLQCKDTQKISKAYITMSPCITCGKLLLNTSCQEIIFSEEWVNLDAKRIWKNARRLWTPANAIVDSGIKVDPSTGLPGLNKS